ncbi:hypothetical protein Dda_3136 [Drechslerella dactyloides]|uniref:S-adenosyl-L-methionine-dependent methyltransferase n=1 Tax=Drechslerella dactyloides TaxID=74499 RepID=A0AAD6NKZ8_DREDA|nr:hypothetical protein Dda_3136 [Drechslerella dactyloides]
MLSIIRTTTVSLAMSKKRQKKGSPSGSGSSPHHAPTKAQYDRTAAREDIVQGRFKAIDPAAEAREQRRAAEAAQAAAALAKKQAERLMTWWAAKMIEARKANAPPGMEPRYADIKIPEHWPTPQIPPEELQRLKGPRLSRTIYWWLTASNSTPSASHPAPPRPPPKYPTMKLSPDKPSSLTPLTPAQRTKRVRGIYWIAGLGVWAMTSYGAYLYLQYGKAHRIYEQNEREYALGFRSRPEVDTLEVYEGISDRYDAGVRLSELFIGMPLLRRWMLWGLEGDVLEASAGTGRNNPYYDVGRCSSITMVDNSPNMLEIAKSDFHKTDGYLTRPGRYPNYGRIAFAAQDASSPISSPSGEGFDRVVQTMGLCSQKSPVATLRNLERHCKPGGKILLLEHGRSHYDWLNRILDTYVLDHARSWGCFWNRDIGQLLQESGLVVSRISRFHLGTTWLIEASPRPRSAAQLRDETAQPGSLAGDRDCAERDAV